MTRPSWLIFPSICPTSSISLAQFVHLAVFAGVGALEPVPERERTLLVRELQFTIVNGGEHEGNSRERSEIEGYTAVTPQYYSKNKIATPLTRARCATCRPTGDQLARRSGWCFLCRGRRGPSDFRTSIRTQRHAATLDSDAKSEGEEAEEYVRQITDSEADITDGRLEAREVPARAIGNWFRYGWPARWGLAQGINQLGEIGIQFSKMLIWMKPSELSEDAEDVFCTCEQARRPAARYSPADTSTYARATRAEHKGTAPASSSPTDDVAQGQSRRSKNGGARRVQTLLSLLQPVAHNRLRRRGGLGRGEPDRPRRAPNRRNLHRSAGQAHRCTRRRRREASQAQSAPEGHRASRAKVIEHRGPDHGAAHRRNDARPEPGRDPDAGDARRARTKDASLGKLGATPTCSIYRLRAHGSVWTDWGRADPLKATKARARPAGNSAVAKDELGIRGFNVLTCVSINSQAINCATLRWVTAP